MFRCPRSLPFALVLLLAPWLPAQRNALAEPTVAIVADGGDGPMLEALLRREGMRTRRFATDACAPAALRLADVVVVVWPEESAFAAVPPLGELERWDRPTVFVGCGERFARAWGLPTPAEIAERGVVERWPETSRLAPPDGASTAVLRQGHLFHFQGEPKTVFATAAERAWLAQTVRHAARFVTDRPIVRHTTTNGAPMAAEETTRRQRIDAAASTLALDPTDMNVLLLLPDQLGGEHAEVAATLLHDVIADGPNPDTSRKNWHNWLKPRLGAMVWDPLSRVWRIDPLAYARGVATSTLSGDARADGGECDPAAVALASKVAQRYGGRAFDDLTTFTCWQGEVCYLWDRRGGWFRIENHGVLPAGARGVQWHVAVLDVAADRDAIQGGGPAPRPRVSARSAFRSLLVQVFLPAMLLDPGTSLRLRPEADSADQRALVVRLAHRGLDPASEYLVMVVAATGEIASLQESNNGRLMMLSECVSSTPCGPMLLPSAWRRRGVDFRFDDPTWNPDLPAGIDSAPGKLTSPRDR